MNWRRRNDTTETEADTEMCKKNRKNWNKITDEAEGMHGNKKNTNNEMQYGRETRMEKNKWEKKSHK